MKSWNVAPCLKVTGCDHSIFRSVFTKLFGWSQFFFYRLDFIE